MKKGMVFLICALTAVCLFAAPAVNAQGEAERCDLNGDGVCCITDVTVLLNVLSSSNEAEPRYDVNGDGNVDVTDVTALLNYLAGAEEPHESEGLEFTLMNVGELSGTYAVTGVGTNTDTTIVIPATYNGLPVTRIGSNCMAKAKYRIQKVVIPEGVQEIGAEAFKGCSKLTSIVLPDSVKTVGKSAFADCSALESIRFSAAMTYIPANAFENCYALTEVTVPEGIVRLGDGAFYKCVGLTKINLPASLTEIGEKAFGACRALTEFSVSADNPVYRAGVGCVIEPASKTLVCGCKTAVIPDDGSVTVIGAYAFYASWDLTDVTIPEGVTALEDSAFNSAGLTSISLPSTLKSIGNSALSATKLEEIILPEGVEVVKDYAFHSCAQLRKVVVPQSVSELGFSLFYGCGVLEEVTLPTVYNRFGSYFGTSSYAGSVKVVQDYTTFYLPKTLRSVRVTGGVLNNYAFINCSMLTELSIEGVTWIGSSVFSGCTSLTSLVIPDSVTECGTSIVAKCTALREVVIGENLPYFTLGSGTCPALETITIDKDNPWLYSTGDCVIEKETGTLIDAAYCFELPLDGSLKSIGVISLQNRAWMTSIVIPKSVTKIGNLAFYGSDNLKTVYYTGSEADWAKIVIGQSNVPLESAEIVFNYLPD